MYFTGGIFAVDLNTLEVSRFESQSEASRELGVDKSNINNVIKGKRNTTGGYWFTNADENADDAHLP
jgi:predicted XRE-type DNA-binding protein